MRENDLALLLDLFGNPEEIKLLICTVIFCLVFTAPEKWRVELRAKNGHYRKRSFAHWLDMGSSVGRSCPLKYLTIGCPWAAQTVILHILIWLDSFPLLSQRTRTVHCSRYKAKLSHSTGCNCFSRESPFRESVLLSVFWVPWVKFGHY